MKKYFSKKERDFRNMLFYCEKIVLFKMKRESGSLETFMSMESAAIVSKGKADKLKFILNF